MVQLSSLKVENFVSEPKILYRLYVGNLKPNCSEQSLRSLFALHAVEVESILVKRSYAFVDCVDQANADRGIDKFNGETQCLVSSAVHFKTWICLFLMQTVNENLPVVFTPVSK